MLSLRLLFRLGLLVTTLLVAAGCGDDDGTTSSGGASGGGSPVTGAGADASDVVGVLSGLDSGANPGLGDAGRDPDGGTPSQGDGGIATPDDAGAALCGNGRLDGAEACDPGLDPCCKRTCDGPVAKGVVCREAAGDCDEPEACSGRDVACPSDDERVPEGEVCRRARGDCDVAEECDGHAVDCPSDELAPEGEECRPAEGACDVAEECDGEDADCPSDELAPLGAACRPAADACDAAETCTGSSTVCPLDLPSHCAVEVLEGELPISVEGTTAGTCATYVPSCATTGTNANERVYVFTAPATGSYRFDTLGSTYDTVLALRSGTSCGAAELACSDDTPGAIPASLLEAALVAGQTVLVMVDGYNGTSGDFTLSIRRTTDHTGWTCPVARFGGDDGCDCGCGALDPDCAGATSDSCERCTTCLEHAQPCGGSPRVNAADNSQCTGWLCPNAWYDAGDGCDCGCGALDPDCGSMDPSECDSCAACGDSSYPCGGSASVDETDNTLCTTSWTCDATYYGDTFCDCGCGVVDPDCAGVTHDACRYCEACGDTTVECAGSASIDPNNNTVCAPETPVWTCNPAWYDEPTPNSCDCGCGIPDPDCASASASECDYCVPCRDGAMPCHDSPNVVSDDNTRCQ